MLGVMGSHSHIDQGGAGLLIGVGEEYNISMVRGSFTGRLHSEALGACHSGSLDHVKQKLARAPGRLPEFR